MKLYHFPPRRRRVRSRALTGAVLRCKLPIWSRHGLWHRRALAGRGDRRGSSASAAWLLVRKCAAVARPSMRDWVIVPPVWRLQPRGGRALLFGGPRRGFSGGTREPDDDAGLAPVACAQYVRAGASRLLASVPPVWRLQPCGGRALPLRRLVLWLSGPFGLLWRPGVRGACAVGRLHVVLRRGHKSPPSVPAARVIASSRRFGCSDRAVAGLSTLEAPPVGSSRWEAGRLLWRASGCRAASSFHRQCQRHG